MSKKKETGRVEHSLEQSTQVVKLATGFIQALTGLTVSTVAFAGVIIGIYQPPVNQPLPKGCTPETLQVRDLPPYKAANEIFWKRHPEVHRRQIRPDEGKYSDEWWLDLEKVSRCRR